MTKVVYQIGYASPPNGTETIDDLLLDLLTQTFADAYIDIEAFVITDWFNIQYEHEFEQSQRYLVGIELNLPDDVITDSSRFIDDFTYRLHSHQAIFIVCKFFDEQLFQQLQMLYAQIFAIEMRLREVATFIFNDTYRSNYQDCLTEINISSMLEKDFKNNLSGKIDRLRARYENEFFHLNFGSYVSLTLVKPLQQGDLIPIAQQAINFDDFRQRILQRGVQREEYRDFFNNIKQHMDALEKVRNCVAHNRTVSSDELRNYSQSLEAVQREIDNFFILIT